MSSIILFREVRHVVEKSLAFPHMLNLLSKALDFVPSLLIQSTRVNHGLHNLLANVSRYNVINVALALLIFFFLFFFFCCTAQFAGLYFPDQESKLGPLQWKCGVLSTGPPATSHLIYF